MIAKGKTAWMDLSLYQTRSSTYLSFLTFSWGIVADIDIESEAVRFLGSLRMDVVSTKSIHVFIFFQFFSIYMGTIS